MLENKEIHNLPNTVKYIAVWKDTYVHIGHKDVVESTFLFISEKCIRHPNLLRICHGEVLYPFYIEKKNKNVSFQLTIKETILGFSEKSLFSKSFTL